MLLGQVSVSNLSQSFVFELVVTIFFALLVFNIILQIKERLKAKPTLQEQFDKYQSKACCEKQCISQDLKFDSYDKRIAAISDKSAQSREKLYIRLTQVENALSAVQKADEFQTQHLYSLETKIDKILTALSNLNKAEK